MTTTGIQDLMCVDSLIASKINSILVSEKGNVNHINLYNAGELWVAFDKSAYLLQQVTSHIDEAMVVELKDRPFPLIFHVISNSDAHGLSQRTVNTITTSTHLQFLTRPIDTHDFNTWYRSLVL
jgi:hypothetical protein